MTLTSTDSVSTDDKQKNVNVEDILKEQQEAIAYLKRKMELLERKISMLEDCSNRQYSSRGKNRRPRVTFTVTVSRNSWLGRTWGGGWIAKSCNHHWMPNRYCPQHSYKIYRQKIPNRTSWWKLKTKEDSQTDLRELQRNGVQET